MRLLKKFQKGGKRKSVGLALGSGSALGTAHIGALKAFIDNDIRIDFISGTSIGSMVAAFYACGCLNELEKLALSISKKTVLSYLDMTIPYKGLISGDKIYFLLKKFFKEKNIESLKTPFAAISVDILSGEEVVIKKGKIANAVRASISIPGIFEPLEINGRTFVDGGVVNPVPVDVLRDWGADIIIGINLNRYIPKSYKKKNASLVEKIEEKFLPSLHLGESISVKKKHRLNIFEIINNSSQIIQRKIGDLTFREYPPDFLIEPKLDDFRMFDFHRAKEGIEEGYRCAENIIREIQKKLSS